MRKRSIIVHFHFFKNAGTSVETILRRQFGKRFMTHEPGGPSDTHPASVLTPVLERNETVQAVSSHTICFPPPSRPDWKVFPMVFMRHPLDRILSMYNFEKLQLVQSPGTSLARKHGLEAYIEERLADPAERTLRNYQAWMLAQGPQAPAGEYGLREAANRAVRELPVIGVVDRFAASIGRFDRWLSPHFPGLMMRPVHRHRRSPARLDLDARIGALRDRVGAEQFTRLEDENALDLELYRLACRRLEENPPGLRGGN